MNGNCHFLMGVAVGSMLALNTENIATLLPNIEATNEMAVLYVEGAILGGIFPDIDNPKSFMGRLAMPFSKRIDRIGKFFGKGGKHHRGLFHDMTVYIIGLILSCIYFPALVGFFIGCLSHIYLDLFNPTGIPSLVSEKNLHLCWLTGDITSGSKKAITFTYINIGIVLLIGICIRFQHLLEKIPFFT